ncbi:MAG: hypothetical protein Q9174_002746 [Haloplaca sp. 1 TL-2023]
MSTAVLQFGKTVRGPWLSPPESPRMDSDPMYGDDTWNAVEEHSLLSFRNMDQLYFGVEHRHQSTHQVSHGGQSLDPAPQDSHHVSTSSTDNSPTSSTLILNETRSTPAHHMERPPLTSAVSAPDLTLNQRVHSEEDELLSSASDEDEALNAKEESSKSAAERRAEKRKMKRFRLTHTQTRFLMSEFARQAHPDAAQRDRLSREIPGLSPRQVQVWFQNRRAKLKRLTADDQERMLKSRALPDGFNSTQALHYPHDAASHMNVDAYPPFPQVDRHRNMIVRGGANLGTLHRNQGIRLDTTNVQPEAWPNQGNSFTEYSPTDASATTGIISHPGYRSLNALTGTQDIYAQPTQCSQSAPLAAPPEFQIPQWQMPYQADQFNVATGAPYGEAQQTNPVWLPDQMAQPYSTRPYQANVYTGSFHPPMMAHEDQSNIPPKTEPTERWL